MMSDDDNDYDYDYDYDYDHDYDEFDDDSDHEFSGGKAKIVTRYGDSEVSLSGRHIRSIEGVLFRHLAGLDTSGVKPSLDWGCCEIKALEKDFVFFYGKDISPKMIPDYSYILVRLADNEQGYVSEYFSK